MQASQEQKLFYIIKEQMNTITQFLLELEVVYCSIRWTDKSVPSSIIMLYIIMCDDSYYISSSLCYAALPCLALPSTVQ